MTFADFAITEARFRKHYRTAPPDTWNDQMVPLHEFLELAADDREGKFPFIWSVDRKRQLARLLVDRTMVESCEDRRAFWRMLRSLAGIDKPEISRDEVAAEVRRELAGQLSARLMRLAAGN
jgi:pyruvate-ferredoxin/flavodoxin oxidoreductase